MDINKNPGSENNSSEPTKDIQKNGNKNKPSDQNELEALSNELTKRIGNIGSRNNNGFKFLGISINPLILIVALIIIILFGFTFFNRDDLTRKVTLDEIMRGIKQNNYAQILIQNDGKIAANGKSFLVLNNTSQLNITDSSNYVVSSIKTNGFDIQTLDSFITQLNSQDLFTQFKSILNRQTSVIKEVIVGNNYVIGVRSAGQKSILIKDISESDFLKKLDDNNINLEKYQIPVRKLKIFGKNVDQQTFIDKKNTGQIQNIFILDGLYIAELKPDFVIQSFIDWSPSIYSFTDVLQKEGVSLSSETFEIVSINVPSGVSIGDIISIITLIGFGILIIFIFRGAQNSGMGIMQFGQSKAKVFFGSKTDTTFADVAGIDEARDELNEIVDFLKNPNKYRKLGARIPKGILMVGPPGTGKTLLARAIAGEAKVPFFHTSGSEFEEMLVGAGASRVRDLFAKAKKAAPSLIFIDEIDAVARKRGTKVQTGTTEQTLNQILVEMDGFEKNTNVIILAATNRPDVLDPAILRPGRFDRQVRIDLPDMEGRKKILEIHGKNKPFASDVNLETVAKRTIGFTGADLENILNEAAIIAANLNKSVINSHDIEEAVSKVILGPAKKSRKRTDAELKLVAYHEAGHAVVAKYTPFATPVDKISIVSRGNTGGVTMFLPEKDENIVSRNRLIADVTVSLGGRAAEELALDDISTGASNDIEKATHVAKRMVQKFGMSKKLGLVQYGELEDSEYLGYAYGESRTFSEKTAEDIDSEVKEIIALAYESARRVLAEHRDKLDNVANALLEKEVMGREEFDKLF